MTMISGKRFAHMARKWQRMAALTKKRHTSSPPENKADGSPCSTSSVAGKGHFVVYTADGRRYEVPLAYLRTAVFGELLAMSQEEFGFAGDEGRITLPCDSTVMEYVMCVLIREEASEEVERAFLRSVVRPCQSACGMAPSIGLIQQLAVCM